MTDRHVRSVRGWAETPDCIHRHSKCYIMYTESESNKQTLMIFFTRLNTEYYFVPAREIDGIRGDQS